MTSSLKEKPAFHSNSHVFENYWKRKKKKTGRPFGAEAVDECSLSLAFGWHFPLSALTAEQKQTPLQESVFTVSIYSNTIVQNPNMSLRHSDWEAVRWKRVPFRVSARVWGSIYCFACSHFASGTYFGSFHVFPTNIFYSDLQEYLVSKHISPFYYLFIYYFTADLSVKIKKQCGTNSNLSHERHCLKSLIDKWAGLQG